jgi:superoxide dismutase, Fe-Mn family
MADRRSFLKNSFLLGLSTTTTALIGNEQLKAIEALGGFAGEKFILPELPYNYNALTPFIDEQTMKLHHSKHHQAYVDKLNNALTNYQGDKSLDGLIKEALKLDDAIRNNAGGHFNHSLFWKSMRPAIKDKPNLPEQKIMDAITDKYGNFEAFKEEFQKKALSVFGSGWCWLVKKRNKLEIITTPNQDNPLMLAGAENSTILLGLDVWEHAYYLNYQNKRIDYISAWWNIANWSFAENRF